MATARQEPKKVLKFYREGDQWKPDGQISSFRVSVALLCPALGGSRLLGLMDRKEGKYYLPGSWSKGLFASTPEEAALESLKWIVPKDLSCRSLKYNGLIVNTEASAFAESEGMNYKDVPIGMVPCRNFGLMAAKASTKDVLYDHTFVSVSPDGEAEVIFAYDLIGGDVCGRMALSFLSANSEYEISRLTARRLRCGLRLTDTPAKGLIEKIVYSLEE